MPYEEVKCPECDGPMIARNGKFGKFWGCKNYPVCKGTRDSMGRSKQERDEEKQKELEREQNREHSRFSFKRRYE